MRRPPAFSVNEALRAGWAIARAQWRFYIKVLLAASIPLLVISAIQLPISLELMFRPTTLLNVVNFLLSLISGVLGLVLQMGVMYVTLKLLREEEPLVREVFACWPYTLTCLAAALLYSILCFMGFLLLIIPGLILSLGLYFYSILIFDEDLGPFDSLRRSWEMTRGNKWSLLALFLALGGINLLGAIPLFLGWTITIPMSMAAVAFAYEHMQNAEENARPAEPAIGPSASGLRLPPPIGP